jgi:diaminohydroxyphosphoribosylaminopyrimidine deaminase/5-amino-6-(5-phosphoribosylamino)uracil reductase
VDGVLVGIGTVIKDDPLLTVRLSRGKIKDPVKIVIDPRLHISQKARILTSSGKTLIISGAGGGAGSGAGVPIRKRQELETKGVEILSLPEQEGHISIKELLTHLGRRGITSLLIEGGAEVYSAFLNEQQADKLVIFIAPCLIGGRKAVGMIGGTGVAKISEAIRLKAMKVKSLAGDILVEAYLEK